MNLKHRMISVMVCGALLSPAWMAMGQTPPPAAAPAAAAPAAAAASAPATENVLEKKRKAMKVSKNK